MRNIFLITILSVMTSCYSYRQAENQFKNFEKNKNYMITQNNIKKEIKVLEVNNDSIKVKYFDYNSDMQKRKNIEKISIKDIQNVKTDRLSIIKTSGAVLVTAVVTGLIFYSCCFDLNFD